MEKLKNVQEEICMEIASDTPSKEFAKAVDGIFHITSYRKLRRFESQYRSYFCKPTATISKALLIDREVLALVVPFTTLQTRVLNIVRELVQTYSPRLTPNMAIIVHGDPNGDEKLRMWGRQAGQTIIPIYRQGAGAMPSAEDLRSKLARDLFSSDPYQVTGPVTDDIDFFGRRNEASEYVRQLAQGRIRSIFGIRKIGKTSLINRVIRLARESGCLRIAMIDCSLREFYQLHYRAALGVVAKTAKLAANRGYAHISEAISKPDKDISPVFEEIWQHKPDVPLAIIFDEVDYMTPDAPLGRHWDTEFNDFWREFRVIIQEANRHDFPIALMVSGVSSRWFRAERIADIENSALHFVPETYLSPFARKASVSMIKDLGRRCGLQYDEDASDYLAASCGDFPFWIRTAGSYVHRKIELERRPISIGKKLIEPIVEEFCAGEGVEIAQVAIENIGRAYPAVMKMLRECYADSVSYEKAGLLVKYGLAEQRGKSVSVTSALIRSTLSTLPAEVLSTTVEQELPHEKTVEKAFPLSQTQWAEELAILNRRRNLLEVSLRSLIRYGLKMDPAKGKTWRDEVMQSVDTKRRPQLMAVSPDKLMEGLFWLELGAIVTRNWSIFEKTFGDKSRFELAIKCLNSRPDAHAKSADLAEFALQRRELDWLEGVLA